jgi:hypothetical protein
MNLVSEVVCLFFFFFSEDVCLPNGSVHVRIIHVTVINGIAWRNYELFVPTAEFILAVPHDQVYSVILSDMTIYCVIVYYYVMLYHER